MLNMVASASCGVREAIRKLNWKNSRIISLLKEMEEERLIELRCSRTNKRGRPKKNITCTSLGFDFLETYGRLRMKPLRARKEDLEHAIKDALYAERLVANGHSPFKLFVELNMIANNIKISSEAAETI